MSDLNICENETSNNARNESAQFIIIHILEQQHRVDIK